LHVSIYALCQQLEKGFIGCLDKELCHISVRVFKCQDLNPTHRGSRIYEKQYWAAHFDLTAFDEVTQNTIGAAEQKGSEQQQLGNRPMG
jgi:hypothetical protein